MLEGIRLSKTPGLNAHWQETEPGHDGTHVAFDHSVAAALVAVAEAARARHAVKPGQMRSRDWLEVERALGQSLDTLAAADTLAGEA